MPETEKLSGLVIRSVDYGEGDRILTLLCASQGCITVNAKGVRSLKSKNRPFCHPFVYGDFIVGQRNGRRYVRECSAIADYYDVSLGIERFALMSYICEIISFVCFENQDCTDILSLTLNTFEIIKRGKYSVSHIKAVFELKIACLLGFAPAIVCDECGGETPSMYASFTYGSFLCEKCYEKHREELQTEEEFPVTPPVISAVNYVENNGAKRIFAFSLEETDERLFNIFCESYLICVTEHKYYTIDYLKKLMYS